MTAPRASRERILDAVVSMLSSRGDESVSIRNVAAEAGVSTGSVQHHFPTKEDLIVGAMTAVNEQFRDRVMRLMESEESPEARLRVFCTQISCITEAGLHEAIIWTAFASRSSTDPEIRALHVQNWQRTEQVLHGLLLAAFPASEVTADDAALVLAVADGIAVARAAEQADRMTTERSERLIRAAIAPIAARVRR